MSFYSEMADLVTDFTTGEMFGDGTLSRVNAGAFDPVTGTVTNTSTPLPCRAVARQITTTADNGALVTSTMVTLNIEPKTGDTLTIGSASYLIGEVITVAPVGTALIWRAMVAK